MSAEHGWERVNAARVPEFKQSWHDGQTTRLMAKQFGMSLGTVWKVVDRLGLPRRASPIRRQPVAAKALIARWC